MMPFNIITPSLFCSALDGQMTIGHSVHQSAINGEFCVFTQNWPFPRRPTSTLFEFSKYANPMERRKRKDTKATSIFLFLVIFAGV